MQWAKVFYVIFALFIAWFLYRFIRGDKPAFSRENLGKSFHTLAILALLLIALIGLCVILLRG